MRDRVVTLALAVGAFVLFYALFLPKPANTEKRAALPVSTEIAGDGYQALWLWLRAQGIQVVSFRERYNLLARRSAGETGNVLIATLPQQLPARPDELVELDKWLERGNSLLILAALDDTPKWALQSASDLDSVLTRMTRLKFEVIADKAPDKGPSSSAATLQTIQQAIRQLIEPQRASIVPRGSHPLFAGVKSIATQSEYPASRWQARSMDASAFLILGERSDVANSSELAKPAVWLKRHGQGQIIVMAFASPFSNSLIGKQDNARLFANITGWSRGEQGAVLFDDAHQGLVSYYDANAFFADPRLHRSLLWLCLLWLVFVLGWQRFRPHTDSWIPVDVTTLIKVTGGFLAGTVAANVAGQRLFENFFNKIRQRLALPQNGLPVWEWLSSQASIPVHDLESLRRLHVRAQTPRRMDLVQLQNRLTTIMGNLV